MVKCPNCEKCWKQILILMILIISGSLTHAENGEIGLGFYDYNFTEPVGVGDMFGLDIYFIDFDHWVGLFDARLTIWVIVGDQKLYWPNWTEQEYSKVLDVYSVKMNAHYCDFEIIRPFVWLGGVGNGSVEFHATIHDCYGNLRSNEAVQVISWEN